MFDVDVVWHKILVSLLVSSISLSVAIFFSTLPLEKG